MSDGNNEETVIPAHGRGRLRKGGKPGNKGGTGRPPEALRIKSRQLFDKWLEWAAKQASESAPDANLMMQIGNTAAKYGLGTTFTPTDTEGKTLTAVRVTHHIVGGS